MAKLVGTWSGTAEMPEPSPEEMKKMMPPGSPEPPTSMVGASKSEMILDGTALMSHGWYEMDPDQKANYVEILA